MVATQVGCPYVSGMRYWGKEGEISHPHDPVCLQNRFAEGASSEHMAEGAKGGHEDDELTDWVGGGSDTDTQPDARGSAHLRPIPDPARGHRTDGERPFRCPDKWGMRAPTPKEMGQNAFTCPYKTAWAIKAHRESLWGYAFRPFNDELFPRHPHRARPLPTVRL